MDEKLENTEIESNHADHLPKRVLFGQRIWSDALRLESKLELFSA